MQFSNLSVDHFYFAEISFQLYLRSTFATLPITFVASSTFIITDLVAPLPVGCRLTVRFSSSSDDRIHN